MIQWLLAIWSLVPPPFSKPSLYIWKFSVHILLKPILEDFEHNLASMWNEHNCTVVWTFCGIVLLWDWDPLVAQMVKSLPAMRETRFDPWVRKIPWGRKWQPIPVFSRKSHGRRSLAGHSPFCCKESDMTEQLHFTSLLWAWNENWPFPALWPLLSFSNLLTYQAQHFNSIIS